MESNGIFVLVEPAYVMPVWFEKGILGLQKSAAKKRLPLHLISPEELSDCRGKTKSAIVVSSRSDWTLGVLSRLRDCGIKPILIGTVPEEFGETISAVIFNQNAFMETIVCYLYQCGRRKPALVGINSNSSNDNTKYHTFLSVTESLKMEAGKEDVFLIDDDIIGAIELFCENSQKYDCAICPNDYIAVCLLEAARRHKIRVPESLYVVGMGNMLVSMCSTPALTTFQHNYYEVGVQAVNLWDLLEHNPNLDAINILLHGELVCRGSTAYQNPPPYESFHSSTARDHPELSIGKVNRTIRGLENCLLQCDQLDFGIIREIILGSSLENTAEALFISQGTLRYRLKKMYQAAGVSSRQELERILKRYVTNHQAFDELLNAPAP